MEDKVKKEIDVSRANDDNDVRIDGTNPFRDIITETDDQKEKELDPTIRRTNQTEEKNTNHEPNKVHVPNIVHNVSETNQTDHHSERCELYRKPLTVLEIFENEIEAI